MIDEFDQLILTKMPRFIAVSYQKMLLAETSEEKVWATLHVYDLGLRILTLGLVSQYLIRDRDRVSDPYLNQLLLEKLPGGGLDTWQHLLFVTLKVYEGQQDLLFVPELYELYWDTFSLPHRPRPNVEAPFTRLTQIRNDLEHSIQPADEDSWHKLSEETLELLHQILLRLAFFKDYELVRIVSREEQTYTYECHVGLTITQQQWVGTADVALQSGWFYLCKHRQEFLLLHPLLIFWEESVPPSLLVNSNQDTAIFERLIYSNLQYLLPLLGKKLKTLKHSRSLFNWSSTRSMRSNEYGGRWRN